MLKIRLIPVREGPLLTCTSGLTVIGSGDQCDAKIPHYTVSAKHCSIQAVDGVLLLRDMASMTGTAVNGQLTKRTYLEPGDTIDIGGLSFRLEVTRVEPEVLTPTVESPKQRSVEDVIAETLNSKPDVDAASNGQTHAPVESSARTNHEATAAWEARRVPLAVGEVAAPPRPSAAPPATLPKGRTSPAVPAARQREPIAWGWPMAKLLGVVCIALLVFVPWGELGQTSNEHLYTFYESALKEMVALRARQAPAAEWEELRQRLEAQNQIFVKELETTSDADHPIRQQFLYAGRDHLPQALGGGSPRHEDSLRIAVENARFLLDGKEFAPVPEATEFLIPGQPSSP